MQILPRAAVVELAPPDSRDLRDYLRLRTPPFRAGLWQQVFTRLAEQPDGTLAATLAKPLMAWLAAQTYAHGPAEPAELLGFDDPDTLGRLLLGGLVPALYDRNHLPGGPTRPPGERAGRALSFLARRVARPGVTAVAWWRLDQLVPVAVQACVGATVFGTLVAAV